MRARLVVLIVAVATLAAATQRVGATAPRAVPIVGADSDSVALRASAEALKRMTPCTVENVIDGDTIRCERVGRVRLLLIDSPERDQEPWGSRARQALDVLIPAGSEVHLETDVQLRDRYGRLLAYVYRADGLQVNEIMLKSGFADVVVFSPNVRHVDVLRDVRDGAREAGRGLWSTPAFECVPRDHRAKVCE